MKNLLPIAVWVCALAMFVASVGAVPLQASAMVQQHRTAAAALSENDAADLDANGDGAVDVRDLQRLIALAGEPAPEEAPEPEEDAPISTAPGAVVLVVADATSFFAYEGDEPVVAISYASTSDDAPRVSRYWRYSRIPHGPPSVHAS